tara:strand:+ start:685 stop:1233 length:549 start_codon:yes stop_codon:yes gene_type:complete
MQHHLLAYPPGKKQRPHKTYIDPTQVSDHPTFFGIGLEWLVPIFCLIIFTIGIEYVMGLSTISIITSLSIMVLYAKFMFGWLHDSMHIKQHWFMRVPLVRRYFKHIRKLHDIHHHHVSEEGLMKYNMGISTPLFDMVFRTYLPNMKGTQRKSILTGHKTALTRYNIVSLRGDEIDAHYKEVS